MNCLTSNHLVYMYLCRWKHLKITNPMEQSPSCGAISHSTSQEIPHLLWNPKVHYFVHRGLPLTPILNQYIQSITSHPVPQRFIPVLCSHLCLGFPSGFCLQVSHPRFHIHFPFCRSFQRILIPRPCVTCCNKLVFLC